MQGPNKPKGPSGRGARELTVRVKTARRRKIGSTRWLERQLNDPYVAAARREGYASRAAYKLQGLDEQFKLLRRGMRVLDLGAAPGGWCQVVEQKLKGSGKIVGVDLLPFGPLAGVSCYQLDVELPDSEVQMTEWLGGRADLVLSDMAPSTTGHQTTDQIRIASLADIAYDVAKSMLAPEGHFVVKLFQGGAHGDLLNTLKKDFKAVRHAKPPASRKDSSELYLVAQGYRGTPSA
ncbi:MAG: RlmE family RNA methyltransferase [Alphaproteobacteria bacterium]|jgi:23S rRNA (uridine2552-2'-O)-methyltransferase